MDTIAPDKLEEVLRGIKIPPQPQIMIDIQTELAIPGCGLDCIADLISKDVGLAGSILKTVNAPIFALRSKVTSINQAIGLLGIDSVINIVNAASLQKELSNVSIAKLTGFWDNAMDIASACMLIAKKEGSVSSDEAYTLGLFHNCAIPLLMMKFKGYSEVIKATYSEQTKRISEIESEHLHTNHNTIGYIVARTWKLPDYLCEAINEHHYCEHIFSSGKHDASMKHNLLAVLKLAEHICGAHKVIGDCEIDYEFERLREGLLGYMGLTDIDIDNLRDDLVDQGIGV